MQQIEIRVAGMTCGGCERSIQNALTARQGVSAAIADRSKGVVAVEFDPAVVGQGELEQAIRTAGFTVEA